MRIPKPRRPPRLRGRKDPFHRAKHGGDLDIVMPPPYEIGAAEQQEARGRVESLIGQLQPGGLDGNSPDVLNNLINAWMDQQVALLRSHRREREAVAGILIGLAREEVVRRRHRYEADYARAQQARQTLGLAYAQLTGGRLTDLPSPYPQHTSDEPVRPTADLVIHPIDMPGIRLPSPSANGHGKPGNAIQEGAVT